MYKGTVLQQNHTGGLHVFLICNKILKGQPQNPSHLWVGFPVSPSLGPVEVNFYQFP
jgi:hypothetical protein